MIDLFNNIKNDLDDFFNNIHTTEEIETLEDKDEEIEEI